MEEECAALVAYLSAALAGETHPLRPELLPIRSALLKLSRPRMPDPALPDP